MQIVWKGQSCFFLGFQRSKQEQVRIVTDPFGEKEGLKPFSGEADVVLITHDHPDPDRAKAIKPDPLVISNPGEYEIKDISIKGIGFRGNTVYVIEAEGIRLCHLGSIGQGELSAGQVGEIGNIDILFVPVGGTYTLGAKGAAKIVSQIEPRIVVPMHYLIPRLKRKLDKVDEFLKEMGVKNIEPQTKLNVKARDFSREEMKVVVLTP